MIGMDVPEQQGVVEWYVKTRIAGMVELVDAPDSKSGGLRPLRVRVPLPALRISVIFQYLCTIFAKFHAYFVDFQRRQSILQFLRQI